VRVTTVPATLGGPLQAGHPVLQGTSTTRVVTIALAADQQSLVKVGDQVVITLPDNSTTPGKVTSVGTVATASSSSNGRGGNGSSPPTVTVEVQPTDAAATGSLDEAPVKVEITTEVVDNALSVPVTALVGKSGGGFAVEVVRADGRRDLIAVKLGLFDSGGGRVQVEGDLHEGDQVVVPSL
jgi:multidrug efflux pump subunit AcrA (membrane-fusion protein)